MLCQSKSLLEVGLPGERGVLVLLLELLVIWRNLERPLELLDLVRGRARLRLRLELRLKVRRRLRVRLRLRLGAGVRRRP